MKYLLITLKVQDGERSHTHRNLHTTNAENINFAAERYASTYWGWGEREDNYWWFHGEITVRLERVTEVSEYEYKLMSELFGGRTGRNDYFEVVAACYNHDLQREEIQIHAGENGNVFLIKTEEGFIIDVYNQDDNVDTMTIWEDDLTPNSDDETPEELVFSTQEIDDFVETWGQTHTDVCDALGYSHKESDDLLMVDYFWLPVDKKWLPKIASTYTEREQQLADYLRNKS